VEKKQQSNTKLNNKEKAMSFLQLVASGQVREAYQGYISPDFCHHNPFFPGDADSLMHAMEENAEQNPDKTLEVKLAIEEKETVVIYSHVKQNPNDLGVAVVHIFRFQDGRIVELWDIGQSIPENSSNKNGIF
jgi:predicted SnoaL-like aldol condensation-catalyzing enzyme